MITDTDMLPRDPAQRVRDVRARLVADMDLWVASADADGRPYLVPLSFLWDGDAVWVVTRLSNPTGRNLAAGSRTRLALGTTRDVVLVDGEAVAYTQDDVPAPVAEGFRDKTGWDARAAGPAYRWFRIRPATVEAWHEYPEFPDRRLMTDGAWVAGAAEDVRQR
ncbi:pyridoxamine 5'-phosphate oxidase family protein [Streptomyces sp. NPDC054975]